MLISLATALFVSCSHDFACLTNSNFIFIISAVHDVEMYDASLNSILVMSPTIYFLLQATDYFFV